MLTVLMTALVCASTPNTPRNGIEGDVEMHVVGGAAPVQDIRTFVADLQAQRKAALEIYRRRVCRKITKDKQELIHNLVIQNHHLAGNLKYLLNVGKSLTFTERQTEALPIYQAMLADLVASKRTLHNLYTDTVTIAAVRSISQNITDRVKSEEERGYAICTQNRHKKDKTYVHALFTQYNSLRIGQCEATLRAQDERLNRQTRQLHAILHTLSQHAAKLQQHDQEIATLKKGFDLAFNTIQKLVTKVSALDKRVNDLEEKIPAIAVQIECLEALKSEIRKLSELREQDQIANLEKFNRIEAELRVLTEQYATIIEKIDHLDHKKLDKTKFEEFAQRVSNDMAELQEKGLELIDQVQACFTTNARLETQMQHKLDDDFVVQHTQFAVDMESRIAALEKMRMEIQVAEVANVESHATEEFVDLDLQTALLDDAQTPHEGQ